MQEHLCLLSLSDRTNLVIDGVKEIISFEDEIIILYTSVGDLRIKGLGLEVVSAFSDSQKVEICGRINSLSFSDNSERLADNIISRLFR